MRRIPLALLLLLALLPGAAFGAACDVRPTLTLDAKELAAAGIRTSPLKAAQHTPEIAAYGRVLDPAPLAALSAALAAARGEVAADKAKTDLARDKERRAHLL